LSEAALRERWSRLSAARRPALIPYLTAGYPTRDESLAALTMAVDAGADFIELGIPFSDPLADGPTIQRSTQVALENGMSVSGALELAREAALEVPVIAFGYLNPILAYGLDRFLVEAAAAGIDGLLLTDLPRGEDPEVELAVSRSALAVITLVAPTTEDLRLRQILQGARGFVYVISRLGVTGAATRLDAGVADTVARVRRATELPVVVGFGIGTGEQAAQAAQYADGVVVGSALVRRLADGLGPARALMHELRAALDGAAVGSAKAT
jgi:tryptophan synthase alpha chain